MKVVVVGGTGLIGRAVEERLLRLGHEVLIAAPSTGVDAVTGEGVDGAFQGADAVVDVSNSPDWDPQALLDFFRTSTANQLAAEVKAGVAHHVIVSIVGAERAADNFYMRAKIAQEEVVREGEVPFTIIKATQFFEFLRGIADASTTDGEVRVTDAALQPIAAADVADQVVQAVLDGPSGVREIAGPQALPLADMVRTVLEFDGDERVVVPEHSAGYFGTVIEDDTLVATPGAGAWIAETDLWAWLARA